MAMMVYEINLKLRLLSAHGEAPGRAAIRGGHNTAPRHENGQRRACARDASPEIKQTKP